MGATLSQDRDQKPRCRGGADIQFMFESQECASQFPTLANSECYLLRISGQHHSLESAMFLFERASCAPVSTVACESVSPALQFTFTAPMHRELLFSDSACLRAIFCSTPLNMTG